MSRQTSWLQRAKQLLEDNANALDASSIQRLRLARQIAIASASRAPVRRYWTAGLATAAALILAFGLGRDLRDTAPPPATPDPTAVTALDEVDLLDADDSLEMVEDLAFYAWLEDVEDDGNG